jgi:hypothetical protein
MDFIISETQSSFSNSYCQIGNFYIQYISNNAIFQRELAVENSSCLILADANLSFLQAITSSFSSASIEENINLLNNGYILYADKLTKTITLYTDIFGFYHIYYYYNAKIFSISSDFKELLKYSNKQIDDFAVLDTILFNYTLFERTVVNDIKRLIGGTKATWDGVSFKKDVCFNFANNFQFSKAKNPLTYKKFAGELVKGIQRETIPSVPVQITMTGGFDSRAILAACKHLDFSVNAFTFGQESNIEIETLNPFINRFVDSYQFLLLDESYIKSIPDVFQSFIYKNLDNPVFHSLVEFQYCTTKIPSSNLIVGFMGGELMNGQSLGSQVTFTSFAARFLLTSDFEDQKINLLRQLNEISFLNHDYVISISDDYLKTLQPYFHKLNNTNVLRFIINEEYAKFFGAVNKVFKNTQNLIVPFMSYGLLELLINSDISFLKKKLFKSNPLANYRSKVLYAKSILYLCPSLADSKFDRLYRVKDLSKIYFIPKAVFFYLLNHLFRKNSNMFTRTTLYEQWYKDIVISKINSNESKVKILLAKQQLSSEDYNVLSSFNIRELLRLAALIISAEYIKLKQD